jgi:hypothetical protein
MFTINVLIPYDTHEVNAESEKWLATDRRPEFDSRQGQAGHVKQLPTQRVLESSRKVNLATH